MATPVQNPPVWDEAEQEMARRYAQTATNNTILHAHLLNSLEQDMAFASAFMDRLKATAAQLRNLTGA